MIKQITINLPVADVARSVAFFTALGFERNPHFCDDTAACMILHDAIVVMPMSHAKFRELTPKVICDTSQAVQTLFCLTCESRQEVDNLVTKALAAGGTTNEKAEDYGFMYTHSFIDPDGHGWGLIFMGEMPAQA